MTSSNGNIFRVTGHLCGEFTGPRWIPRHKGQWRGALMFSLIWVWINDWVNNREAGDLRRYRAHYDVIVMSMCRWCVMMYVFRNPSAIPGFLVIPPRCLVAIVSSGFRLRLRSSLTNKWVPEQNGWNFADDTFQRVFLTENAEFLIQVSLWFIILTGPNWQYVSIGSGNDLAPNRRQAFTWSNVDPDLWCHHAKSALIRVKVWRRICTKSLLQPKVAQFSEAKVLASLG